MIRLQYVDIHYIGKYYNHTQRYFQDWDGSWYFLTCCGVYHVGQVLSEHVHRKQSIYIGMSV